MKISFSSKLNKTVILCGLILCINTNVIASKDMSNLVEKKAGANNARAKMTEEKFKEMKDNFMKNLNSRKANIEKAINCVKNVGSVKDRKKLRECRKQLRKEQSKIGRSNLGNRRNSKERKKKFRNKMKDKMRN